MVNLLTKRKGQLTVFIIMGMVILIVIGMVLYIAAQTTKNKFELQSKKTEFAKLTRTSVDSFMQSCLDSALIDSLRLIGEEGGIINKNQSYSMFIKNTPALNLTTRDYYDNKTKNFSVAYSLFSPVNNKGYAINFQYNPTEIYPCYFGMVDSKLNEKPISECYYNYNHSQYFWNGFFGSDVFAINETINLEEGEHSIKRQIETYINGYVTDCMNSYNFAEIDLKLNSVDSEVRFSNENVNARLLVNLQMTLDGSIAISSKDFYSKQPVRLKTIIEMVNYVIENDRSHFDHILLKGFKDYALNNKIKFFEQDFIKEIYSSTEGKIYLIEDDVSNIGGFPYYYQFAIGNRRPALNYIKNGVNFPYEGYDIVAFVGMPIVLEPKAFDPDESNLVYTYTGWKADYDDSINMGEDCTGSYVPFSGNLWENSETYLTNKTCKEKFRCAEIMTSCRDVTNDGQYHIVTVTATDGVYSDSQEVRIKVIDEPIINYEIINLYGDNYKNNLSLEDPFNIDFSKSQPINDLQFKWKHEGGGEFTGELSSLKEYSSFNSNSVLAVSGDINFITPILYGLFSVDDIVSNGDFTFTIYSRKKSSTDNVEQAVIVPINVKQCIPYKSNIPSYPFNSIEGIAGIENTISLAGANSEDLPFLGDHSCCNDDGTYKSEGTPCYNLVQYGKLSSFCFGNNGINNDYKIFSSPICKDDLSCKKYCETINPVTYDLNKAIFKRNITSTCDGKRGNMCGSVHVKLEKVGDCTGNINSNNPSLISTEVCSSSGGTNQ